MYKLRRLFLSQFVFLFMSLCFVTSASAGLSQTQTFEDVPNYPATLTFDKYDGNETLHGVNVTFELLVWDGHYDFDNDNSVIANVVIDLEVSGLLSSVDVTLPTLGSQTISYNTSVDLGANDGDSTRTYDTGGGDYFSLMIGPLTGTQSGTVTSGDLSGYLGTDTFDIELDVDQFLMITAGGGVNYQVVPVLAKGIVTVDYLTPEPTTLILLGLGGLILRKRK
jgi:hypothetical protein